MNSKESRGLAGRFLLLALLLAIVTLAGLALMAGSASAQVRDWNRLDDPMQAALGLHAGKIGGTGLAYKYPALWWLNLQVAGGIWHAGDDDRHNLGFETQMTLRQDARLRLFAAAGLGYYYHRERGQDEAGVETSDTSDSWFGGFGVGVEYLRWERMSIQVEVDFTHDSEDGDFILFPQGGLFFYF